jgi:hypothetical protein
MVAGLAFFAHAFRSLAGERRRSKGNWRAAITRMPIEDPARRSPMLALL